MSIDTEHAPLLCIERDRLRHDFDRVPFAISHRLCDHPLLQLPRLIELARTLPAEAVEYNSGDLCIGQDPALTPRTGLGVEETLQQIATRRSWMVLKYIESDPEYARLLDACLDPVEHVLADIAPGMCRRHAFVFVSSPGAVTPFHVDFEHNFLLQLRGSKQMAVWDGEDRVVMAEEERERRVTGAPRNLPWRDEFAALGQTFALHPGDGLQVPLSSPHWVKVGSEVSISLSVTFLTASGTRRRALHTANAFLRRHGVTPREVGRSPLRDGFKFTAFRLVDRVRRLTATEAH